ncbi:MAG TPA: BamA/TamA family outer membrane protein [Sphingorhabdus sp.]|nr:BamA/TamA family outer membrane protein [Sphingorhabdus sp.]
MQFILAYFAFVASSGALAQPEAIPAEPIISDQEFEKAIPKLDDSAGEEEAPLAAPNEGDDRTVETVAPAIDEPLPSLEAFSMEPLADEATTGTNQSGSLVNYAVQIDGLETEGENGSIFNRIKRRFRELSSLSLGGGNAENRLSVNARARADQQLLLDILLSEGFYDGRVNVSSKLSEAAGGPIQVEFRVRPEKRYSLGSVTFEAPADVTESLIRTNFQPKSGDPIVADTIVAAEAQISLALPQNGYPFAQVGQRDILLDETMATGDYTLPIATGPKSYFGQILTEGNPVFDPEHVGILRRFRTGDLYDTRKVDDLREALVGTGLLSTVSIEPVASSELASDGTAYADLLVRQEAGPARTLAASAGYETSRGFRAEGGWIHRNLFPPEGSLGVSGIVGTQEQALAVIFNRSNAGRRDRTIELSVSALHKNYDAFDAYTGRIAGTLSYQSTPIWQKKLTYSIGIELLATYESLFEASRLARARNLYYVAALPTEVGFDRSNDLLHPSRGFRLNLRMSPETALGQGSRFYLRTMLDGSYYQPIGDSFVIAARGRVGTIVGTSRDSLPPSRRYYGGGGGSVRGFGFQQLGPTDIEGNPIGGRSLNEAAAEVRYRFGDFGAVAFFDAGQVYPESTPQFDNWRFGVGVGGRFYTNFGPVRVDVATPINRRPGESRFSFYVSLGQAF